MEVKILSKEKIKPSSSTPKHLRTYKFSFLDQLSPPIYIPILLFYSSGEKSDLFKNSLSETLTKFYPLAGRIKDSFYVDCNDEGALYIEAHVDGDMSMVLHDPEIHELEKLLPTKIYDNSDKVMLAVQMNHFNCGGMVISICIWHGIADGSALGAFVSHWAKVASGASANDIDGVIYDCTSIFPPQDTQNFSWHNSIKEEVLSTVPTKRFVFDSSKIASLKAKVVGNGLSRFEAVTTLIWGVILALTGEEVSALIAVGLRKRMIPPLSQQSLGNIYHFATAMSNISKNENELVDFNDLARKLHDSIGAISDDFVRKIHAGGSYFQFLKEKSKELAKHPDLMKVFGFSSWCKFPFYEADFGCEKPIWVATTFKHYKVAIFLDTKDGQGVEAWVSLPKDDMIKFEQSPYICAYASFKPSTA